MPVLEGLLPEPHNRVVMDLLFTHGHWHGLAKLRMHHDITLDILDAVTKELGMKLRNFNRNTCAAFDTVELRREYQARIRREATKSNSHDPLSRNATLPSSNPPSLQLLQPTIESQGSNGLGTNDRPPDQFTTSREVIFTPTPLGQIQSSEGSRSMRTQTSKMLVGTTAGRRRKKLNINTYKFHSYGDYANTIQIYGTTDSYSTEPVTLHVITTFCDLMPWSQGELEHRVPKSRYIRTSRKFFLGQLTKIERRQARIRRIRQKYNSDSGSSPATSEDVPIVPETHHSIGKTQNLPENIPVFLQNYSNDPAVKVSKHLCLKSQPF